MQIVALHSDPSTLHLTLREESGVESRSRKKSRRGKGVSKKQEQEIKEESEGKETKS
jgi:hypothetical protein